MNGENEPIHLALAFDEKFVVQFYVLLTSIFLNNQKRNLVIHAIASDVESQERLRIQKFVEDNRAVILYYDIDETILKKIAVIPENSHYTVATYFRLFFPEIISREVKKVLYIDVDTVVVGDLFELYSIEIDSVPAAASADMGICGTYRVGSYFNAGVLLMNLEHWRRQRITEKSFRFLKGFPEKVKYADQDALNAVMANNWLKISNRFNLTFNDIPRYLKKSSYGCFISNIVIIHYTGKDKPWLGLGRSRLRFVYHDYLKKSPCSEISRYVDIRLSLPYLLKFVAIRISEELYCYPKLYKFLKSAFRG